MFSFKSLIQKISALDSRTRKRLFVAALALACVAAWFLTTPAEENVIALPKPTESTGALVIKSESMFVHVAGAVKHPGVYAAPKGSRIFELVALAGGFAPKADQSSVNLARTVEDGEQISILKLGSTTGAPLASSPGSAAAAKININRATQLELESLPGVGPKLAGRILDWRGANGNFNHIADLLEVGGIGDKLYAAIKPMVML